MKEHFIQEIRNLLHMICAQGGQVEKIIERAIDAASRADTQLADQVIAGDSTIDREELRIEEECLKVLALYQPVASDLRTVIAILKINTSLERMADFGVHIAERVAAIRQYLDSDKAEPMDFHTMEQGALAMLRDSMNVMKHSDTILAYNVIERDELIDKAHRDNTLLARDAIRRFPEQSGYYIDSIAISHDLERIADIATDICEHIIYLETGRIIRHRA